MKKYAANYILTESNVLLKNSIIISDDSINISSIINTEGELRETERMEFCNGIITSGFKYERSTNNIDSKSYNEYSSSINFDFYISRKSISIDDFIEICKNYQELHKHLTIPEIINQINENLEKDYGFVKTKSQGAYLIKGLDLPELKFLKTTKIKKLL